MRILGHTAELREEVGEARRAGKTVGFVPTMGALHQGHGALMSAAKSRNGFVVVSIFVNPLQFNDPRDLANYPSTAEQDEEICRNLGVDVIMRPSTAEVYPPGFDTTVVPGDLAARYEGAHRPGHFSGMATVVVKLLNMVLADDAYFGRKDFQQLAVVRRMVADLNHPTRVHGVETVREPDGLAMSSRNVNLDPDARRSAARINAALELVRTEWQIGKPLADAVDAGRRLLAQDPAVTIEYFEAADAVDLTPCDDETDARSESSVVVLAAARVGGVRLIDNVELNPREMKK